jgi:hypothetical protein
VAPHAKEISNESMHRQESLRVSGGLEPPHLSLALASRLMRHFCSVVLVLLRAVHDRRHHEAVGRRVATKLAVIRRRRACGPALSIAEEAFGRVAIAPGLKEDVDHVTVVVDGPPEMLPATVDVHEQFVQVPCVAQASLPAPQDTGVLRTESSASQPNSPVGYGDAPLSEEILGISETQTEPVIKPDGVTDDLRRESVSMVTAASFVIGPLCQLPP